LKFSQFTSLGTNLQSYRNVRQVSLIAGKVKYRAVCNAASTFPHKSLFLGGNTAC